MNAEAGLDLEETYPSIPAATVVLMRDAVDAQGVRCVETLMVQRSSKLAFAGGMWVWPGGRIDADDWLHGGPDDLESAARRAAVREAQEEAGLLVEPEGLVWFSHWTPPPILARRFATYFFAAPVSEGEVVVDGSETVDHCWIAPAEALARRNADEIELAPPTWITLEHLARYGDVAEALADLATGSPEYFETHFAAVPGGGVALYHGDVAYEGGDVDQPGPRHRLWMMPSGWRYERTD